MNIREATWQGIGTTVSDCTNLDQVLKTSGLDYQVRKSPIYAENKILVDGKVATVREGDNHVYGIVSENYEICQNRDAFDFVNYINDEIKFVKAGETLGGLVYIIAELPEVKVLGDSFKPHVIFQNGHNGGIAIKAAICPLRIVCQNQFNLAFRDTQNIVVIRHNSTMEGKLIDARNVLSTTASYMDSLTKEAEKYASIKLSSERVSKLIEEFFPITGEMSERTVSTITNKRNELLSAYMEDDNANFRGTVWGMINAASDYISHCSPSRKSDNWQENKFVYVTFNPVFINQFVQFVSERV